MKAKLFYIVLLILLSAGACIIFLYFYFVAPKCPDNYATAEEQTAAMNQWTNDFYDAHPGASLKEWAEARHQFYIDNNCTAALQRYDQAKAGNADPATMELIDNALQRNQAMSTP